MADVTRDNPIAPRVPWRTVYFRLDAPDAHGVNVIGDFNAWDHDKHPLRQDASGVWVCQIPLPPGRYAYCFVVDGVWQLDPQCTQQERTVSGQAHCILEVSEPAEP